MVFDYMDHDMTGLMERLGYKFTVPQVHHYLSSRTACLPQFAILPPCIFQRGAACVNVMNTLQHCPNPVSLPYHYASSWWIILSSYGSNHTDVEMGRPVYVCVLCGQSQVTGAFPRLATLMV